MKLNTTSKGVIWCDVELEGKDAPVMPGTLLKYTREDFAVARRLPFGGEVRVGRLEHDRVEDAIGRLLHYSHHVEEVQVYTVEVEEIPTDMFEIKGDLQFHFSTSELAANLDAPAPAANDDDAEVDWLDVGRRRERRKRASGRPSRGSGLDSAGARAGSGGCRGRGGR